MSPNLEAPSKLGTLLLELRYGAGAATFARYAAQTSDVGFGGETFASTPGLECAEPIERTGGLREARPRISLPLDPFTDVLSDGRAHSPVFARLIELSDGPDGVEALYLFRGRVSKTTRNPRGRPSSVLLELANDKHHAEGAALGLNLDSDCQFFLGGPGCFVDLAPHTISRTITFLSYLGDPKAILVSGGLPVSPPAKFRRGYVEVDGLRLSIREHPTPYGGGELWLAREPPPTWLGASATLVPGCDLKQETCDESWDNLSNFGGSGLEVPSYHPITEQH